MVVARRAASAQPGIEVAMIERRAIAGLLCAFLSVSAVATAQGDGPEAFGRLKSLAGEWQGDYEWTGARTGRGSMTVSYTITGYGSALIENISSDGTLSMTSVYHLDGSDLRMTHFCGAKNQPRLKAKRVDLTQGVVDFDFVDITNALSPDAPHVHGVEIRLIDSTHTTLTFLFQSGGHESREHIVLKRL
jgi:hypothetical protein